MRTVKREVEKAITTLAIIGGALATVMVLHLIVVTLHIACYSELYY